MNQRVKIAGAVGLVVALVGGGVWRWCLAGESVGPVEAAWYVAFLGGVYALVLDEKPSSCGAPADEGQHLALF